MRIFADRPWRLQPDNFTPPTRTPWGGTKILSRYKRSLGLRVPPDTRVGESWEFSVEPSFPSHLDGRPERLDEAIAADPDGWLGREVATRFGGQTPLLVKLLDAAENLSVQVHPRDDDPDLGPGESGKPESWFVLEAEPGAGLYLGFREGVNRDAVSACLQTGGDLSQHLNFVEVHPGDFFRIDAGTPHAIGKGVTLVEPQFVHPGRRGVTYRFWDWNRRYNASGRPDPAGQPRALHVERSLQVTHWSAPRGSALVDACRPPRERLSSGPLQRERLLRWEWFVVELWRGTGTLHVPNPGTLWAIVCVGGRAALETGPHRLDLQMGQSAVVPFACGDLTAHGDDCVLVATCSTTAATRA